MFSSKIIKNGTALQRHPLPEFTGSEPGAGTERDAECVTGDFVAFTQNLEFSSAERANEAANVQRQALEAQAASFRLEIEQLAAAWQEKEALAYQRGYQEGRAEGVELAGDTLKALRRAVELLERHQHSFSVEIEHGVVALSRAMAERVLAEPLEGQQALLLPKLAAMSVQRLQKDGPVRLRFAPEDARLIKSLVTDQSLPLSDAAVRIEADDSLKRGSCLLESDRGSVDASVPAQLDEIVRFILENRSGYQADLTGAEPAEGDDAGQ